MARFLLCSELRFAAERVSRPAFAGVRGFAAETSSAPEAEEKKKAAVVFPYYSAERSWQHIATDRKDEEERQFAIFKAVVEKPLLDAFIPVFSKQKDELVCRICEHLTRLTSPTQQKEKSQWHRHTREHHKQARAAAKCVSTALLCALL